MSTTSIRLGTARAVQVVVVGLAIVVGFATGGVEAAVIAAVVGFFAAKSAESLRRALP